MPELPEVETIRRGLESILLERVIQRVEVGEKDLRWPIPTKEFKRHVVGQKIVALERRAKYLIWRLANDVRVVIHLGMSGQLGIFSPKAPRTKHTHVIFHLSNGQQIRFRDPRRFGLVDVVSPQAIESYERFRHLGPEPLSDDFSASYLHERASKSKRNIKSLLMDASVVVGLGNIYVSEALFYAGILPQRLSASLSKVEARKLKTAIAHVLKKAIAKGGTTLNDYRNAQGEPGLFQLRLAVYGREDEPCIKCEQRIVKAVIGGRSSFFCEKCQK